MDKVILATQNEGKIREMRDIFSKFGMDVISRDEMGLPKDEIEETGTTFEENSYIKASAIAKQCDGIVVADDSGIAVDCIGGKPGVYSARFAGEGCTPHDNNVKLLQLMDGIPTEERGARFVSVMARMASGTIRYLFQKDIIRLLVSCLQSSRTELAIGLSRF